MGLDRGDVISRHVRAGRLPGDGTVQGDGPRRRAIWSGDTDGGEIRASGIKKSLTQRRKGAEKEGSHILFAPLRLCVRLFWYHAPMSSEWSLTARWVFPVDRPPLERGVVTIADDRIAA